MKCSVIALLSLILFTAAVTSIQAQESPEIILVGDSTVTDDFGWGLGFANCLKGNATCLNLAAGGRSSKSYRDEGRWEKVLSKKPAIVLIQFGHNDQFDKGPDRAADAKTAFRDNLARYVDEAKQIGAKPVLITSMSRRIWDPSGKKINSNLTEYVEATIAVAKEKDVPLIDLHELSIQLYEKFGKDACDGIGPPPEKGVPDITHLNANGSKLVGSIVARELRVLMPELEPYIR
ncbi:rhamnogalacturonan acetylesterase [Lacunimicrobium album]